METREECRVTGPRAAREDASRDPEDLLQKMSRDEARNISGSTPMTGSLPGSVQAAGCRVCLNGLGIRF